MDEATEILLSLFDNAPLILLVATLVVGSIFGAPALLRSFRANSDIVRRVSPGAMTLEGGGTGAPDGPSRSKALGAIAGYFESDLAKRDAGDVKVLRKKLIQAGFFDPRATAYFLAARVACAIPLGLAAMLAAPILHEKSTLSTAAMAGLVAAMIGYVAPNIYLRRRVETRQRQIRGGFPDFMDLMVVCSEAGLSIEAAVDRVCGELAPSCPALADNLYLATLEIRAGRTVSEAMAQLAGRLAIDEARSLATLLHQSEELGTSLAQSLRIYSDDMRHKRLMKAEEKAYALPVKLTIPLILFVFPVLIVTILLPVFARFFG